MEVPLGINQLFKSSNNKNCDMGSMVVPKDFKVTGSDLPAANASLMRQFS